MGIRNISDYEEPLFFYNHCVKTDLIQRDYRPHVHKGYEILFVKKGELAHVVDGVAYPMRKNTLVITRPQTRHWLQVSPDTVYERYNFLIAPDTMPAGLLANIPADLNTFSFEGNQLVLGLFDKMDFYCTRLSGKTLGRMLRLLMEEVLVNLLAELSSMKDSLLPCKHPLTQKAVAYMEENLLSIGSVDDICDELSISKSYLYQIFQEDLGDTPKGYLMRRRLELARREIYLGAKATAIYPQCGFADYSAFFRAYKKQFGYAPSETQEYAFREE